MIIRAVWRYAAVLSCILIMTASCRKPVPVALPAAVAGYDPSLVSGQKALERVREFLRISPRDAGTEGAAAAATFLAEELRKIGLRTEIDEFQDATPVGRRKFRNVTGHIAGTSDDVIILASHYDTKTGIGAGFQGANDSGSSTGLLLELASLLKKGPRPANDIVIAFLDGEEAMQYYSDNDGLHGSRRMAKGLSVSGAGKKVMAVIVLDMIGDSDLEVTLPLNSTLSLCSRIFAAAHEHGVRSRFSMSRSAVLDDHVPFLDAGMPAVDIIDFTYGSAPGLNDYWHTPADTIDKLSAASLETTGRVVVSLVNSLMKEKGAVRK